MNKFNRLYNLILEDINSNRKSIRKVNQMEPAEFIQFLKEFLPYVKNGKVDLKDVRITEKIDGSAISLAWTDNDMKFESSYSGVTSWDNLPYPDAGKFLYETYKLVFRDIAEQFGDFKIKGELIWINGMEEDGKVTPIGATYLTNKFGQFGGIVIFEIYKIENKTLINFSEEDEKTIMEMIQDMNNDEFSFYLSQNIILNQNVNFTLNVDELLRIISNPEFNKQKFDEEKDKQVLNEILRIKNNVVSQLSNIIDNSKGAFSDEGDLIEGIVLKINSSGNQYGVFSSGYKEMKEKYWRLFGKVKPIYFEFLKKVFGYSKLSFIKIHWDEIDKEKSQNILNNIKNEYVNKLKNIIDQIRNEDIPSSVKNTQISMATRILNKIESLISIEEFGKDLNE